AQLDTCSTLLNFLSSFIDVAASPVHPFYPSLAEAYLLNPRAAFPALANLTEPAPILNVTQQDFEVRLSQLLNTFWRSSLQPLAWYGASSLADARTQAALESLGATAGVTAASASFEERYECGKAWFALLLICSLVMLLAAVLGICFAFASRGPDIM